MIDVYFIADARRVPFLTLVFLASELLMKHRNFVFLLVTKDAKKFLVFLLNKKRTCRLTLTYLFMFELILSIQLKTEIQQFRSDIYKKHSKSVICQLKNKVRDKILKKVKLKIIRSIEDIQIGGFENDSNWKKFHWVVFIFHQGCYFVFD